MKKLLLVGCLLLAAGAARADGIAGVNAFNLVCQRQFSDINTQELVTENVWLDIVPSENLVRMHNQKGETFDFPVVNASVSVDFQLNVFGSHIEFHIPRLIQFKDKGGRIRNLMYGNGSNPWIAYTYSGMDAAGRGWLYQCIYGRQQ